MADRKADVRARGRQLAMVLLDRLHDVGHGIDRIDAFVRPRGVGGATFDVASPAYDPLVRDDHIQIGRFGDDRGVGASGKSVFGRNCPR